MEENPTLESEAWGSSRGWLAPREARGGRDPHPLSSVLNERPVCHPRYRGPGALPWGGARRRRAGEKEQKGLTEVTQTELQDLHLPGTPWPMQARRAHRQRNARDQVIYGSGTRTDQWARLLRRSKEKTKEGLQSLQPWSWTLKRIGGAVGLAPHGVLLLPAALPALLNVLASVHYGCMTLLPTWLGGAPQGLVTFCHSALQLWPPRRLPHRVTWNGPSFLWLLPAPPRLAVTYLCWAFAVGLICLLLILHRSVSGLKQTLLAESGDLTSYSHRVFSAWNFGLCGDVHVRLRQRIILYELQVRLGAGYATGVWLCRPGWSAVVRSWLTATSASRVQEKSLVQQLPLLKLGVNYLPSIFIAGVNFVLPPVFKLIAPLEGYTRSLQIVFILLRFQPHGDGPGEMEGRRLSRGMLAAGQITCGGDSEAKGLQTCGYNYKELLCWETVLGQEMYKLLLFDLLTALAVALLIQFPRKLLCGLCPGALGRLAGTQEFQVPDEVLGLIYAQTVVWMGSFFCPLLPLLNTVKFLLLFYLKKVRDPLSPFSTCSPAARTFRASTANFFFPLVLLLGLAISSVPLLYSIFLIPPSKPCGPFRGQSSIWAQIPESISSLPETTQNFLFFLGTQAFAAPLLLISSILMAYTVARANSYGRLISELKRQRETEAQNKVFLARRAVALTSTEPAL
uniref:Transmembrane channel-like protein n=1 Tax=Macaca nemestrina TaxID=9545 RepID=A0A2K6DND6_MACNE